MKRIVLSLILSLAALTAAENLHAQGLQGLLNLFANTKAAKADPAAGERLTAEIVRFSCRAVSESDPVS